MTLPTTTFQWSPSTDPLATPSWVTESNRLLSFKTFFGRRDEFGVNETGTFEGVFDNDDRRFDPLNSAGPYFGQLLPNKQMRLQATYSGTTYDVHYDFFDNFNQSYGPNSSRPQFTAKDGFKILQRAAMPRSVFDDVEVGPSSPLVWIRYEEAAGNVFADASGNGHDITLSSSIDLAKYQRPAMPLRIGGGKPIPHLPPFVPSLTPGTLPQATALTFVVWYRSETFNQSPDFVTESLLSWSLDAATSDRTSLFVGGTGNVIQMKRTTVSGFTSTIVSELDIGAPGERFVFDGKTHCLHLQLDFTSMANCKAWIDGVLLSVTTSGPPFVWDATRTLGIPTLADWGSGTIPGFWVSDFLVYNGALSAGLPLQQYNAGTAPWSGQTTGSRVSFVLGHVNWPILSLLSADVGQSTLGSAVLNGAKTLPYLQEVEATEQGELFIDHRNGGKLTFLDRKTLLTGTAQTVSQATFTDDPAGTFHYSDIDIVYDDTLKCNQVIVNWDGGPVTVTDPGVTATTDIQSRTVDSLCKTKAEAVALGQWVLAHYKDVFVRVRSLKLKPSSNPALYPQALGRQKCDRVTVSRLPQNTGPRITTEVLIDGIGHEVDAKAGTWVTTFWLSAANTSAYWVLGTSQLGSTTRLSY